MSGKSHKWLLDHVGHDGPECLSWPFSRTNGYGTFGLDGKMHYAHRFMCRMVNDDPPSPKHDAAHSCGNGHNGCVHPKHLSWKTRSENLLDKRTHGTAYVAARLGKISPQQADEIRALRGQFKQRELAVMYGISRAQVSSIQTGRFRSKRLKGYEVKHGRYYPRAKWEGRNIRLGGFATAEAANAAYLAANEKIRAGIDPRGEE